MHDDLSKTATLLAHPGRAAMLLRLMSGVALPAGELAVAANIAPQTASAHLAKLVDGRILEVERQGRHRYFRLASGEVADAVETLLVLSAGKRQFAAGEDNGVCRASAGSLAHARTCYAHLAGWLGVRIAGALEERSLLVASGEKAYTVTAEGQVWFRRLGVSAGMDGREQRRPARRCLDWTERRHHLAGGLGCALYARLKELRWVVPSRETRAVRVTLEGRRRLWELLRIPIG